MLSKMATLQVPTQVNVLENGATLDRICLISGCVEVRVVKPLGFWYFVHGYGGFAKNPGFLSVFVVFFSKYLFHRTSE